MMCATSRSSLKMWPRQFDRWSQPIFASTRFTSHARSRFRNRVGTPETLDALSRYVEPRYLHQTFARSASGQIVRYVDLDESLTSKPSPDFRDASMWRVHFHVPVDAEHLGPLKTTRQDLKLALAVIPELDYAPHLEVETYTWEVLPGGGTPNIVEGFTRELLATQVAAQATLADCLTRKRG